MGDGLEGTPTFSILSLSEKWTDRKMNTERSSNNAIRGYSRQDSKTEHVRAMSVDELRALEDFKHCSEEELVTMISTVRMFTEIVYGVWSKYQQDVPPASSTIILDIQESKAA